MLGNKINPKRGARSSFAMIGFKGKGKFSWIQSIGKPPNRGPSAISTSISMFRIVLLRWINFNVISSADFLEL